MQWNDCGVIVSVKKFGENSGIIQILSKEHGLYSGIVNSLGSKRSAHIYQLGNIVNAKWKSRLSDQIGYFTIELIESIFPYILTCQIKLTMLYSACYITSISLPERREEEKIFFSLIELFQALKQNIDWKKQYVFYELLLLAELGFGLDFSSCAATGIRNNLTYLSPKSGQAVSTESAQPYSDKLFTLPAFLLNPKTTHATEIDIINALEITGYFIGKNFLLQKIHQIPIRQRLIQLLRSNIELQ